MGPGLVPDRLAGSSPTPQVSRSASAQSSTLPRLACPESATQPRPLPSAKVGPLAPADAVVGRLCHYMARYGQPGAGLLVQDISVADPPGLAALLNQAAPVPSGVMYSCPAFQGGLVEVLLVDARSRLTIVAVPLGGCRFVSSSLTTGRFTLSQDAWLALDRIDPTIGLGASS